LLIWNSQKKIHSVEESSLQEQYPPVAETQDADFPPGTAIDCKMDYYSPWITTGAEIVSMREDGSFEILLNDGSKRSITKDGIRRPLIAAQEQHPLFPPGTKIRYAESYGLLPAVVRCMWTSGSFAIDLEDGTGTFLENVEIDKLKLPLAVSTETHPLYPDGTVVSGNFKGYGTWYPGKIVCMWSNGTFSVAYDDGSNEEEVEIDKLKLPLAVSKDIHPLYPDGTVVSGNYRGYGTWYQGKIVCMWEDGTFAVDYDDGSKEETVDLSNIKLP